MAIGDQAVYGERIDDLLPALMAVRRAMRRRSDGTWTASFELEPASGRPLRRALLRAEAERLLETADDTRPQQSECRSDGERRADAFMRVILAVCRAADRRP